MAQTAERSRRAEREPGWGLCGSGPGRIGVCVAPPFSASSCDSRSLKWVHVSRSLLVPNWNSCQGPGIFFFRYFPSLSVQEMLMLSCFLT